MASLPVRNSFIARELVLLMHKQDPNLVTGKHLKSEFCWKKKKTTHLKHIRSLVDPLQTREKLAMNNIIKTA